MSESSEVVGGGTSVAAAAAAPEVSAAPVEEGGGGTLLEDAPRETEGSALKWAALWRRKVAPRGPTTWIGSLEGKSARPRNKRILWMIHQDSLLHIAMRENEDMSTWRN